MHQTLNDRIVGGVHVLRHVVRAESEAEVCLEAGRRQDPVVPPAQVEVEVVRVQLADAVKTFERRSDFLKKIVLKLPTRLQ